MFETHAGNNYTPETPTSEIIESDAPKVFDRMMLEIVSTGAIAARPYALGNDMKQPKDVFPRKKKRHWYERYAVER